MERLQKPKDQLDKDYIARELSDRKEEFDKYINEYDWQT